MNADIRLALFNRTYDALGKGQLSDGKSRKKKPLTCGASYKPPALPGDTYLSLSAEGQSRHFDRYFRSTAITGHFSVSGGIAQKCHSRLAALVMSGLPPMATLAKMASDELPPISNV
jgi:hypothetical protein